MLATMNWHFFAAIYGGGMQGKFSSRHALAFSTDNPPHLLSTGTEMRVTDWIRRSIFPAARRLLFVRFRHTPRAA
jgi:hypothetical protein